MRQFRGAQEYASNGLVQTQVSIVHLVFKSDVLATHVMRIENCWTGSSHRPIFLINKDG